MNINSLQKFNPFDVNKREKNKIYEKKNNNYLTICQRIICLFQCREGNRGFETVRAD